MTSGLWVPKSSLWTIVTVASLLAIGCSNSNFAGSASKSSEDAAGKEKLPTSPDGGGSDSDSAGEAADGGGNGGGESDFGGAGSGDSEDGGSSAGSGDAEEVDTDAGRISVKRCSPDIAVPASANPYLAGASNGTTIAYNSMKDKPVDTAPGQSPVLMNMASTSCLTAGSILFFHVTGTLNHGGGNPDSTPDGNITENGQNSIIGHVNGATRGIANITAPTNAMVGVFLEGDNPEGHTAPASLDYSASSSRNQTIIRPKVRQVFFIGDGKTSAGKDQQFIVPAGAKRLYLGIMDSYSWNNNYGHLSGGVLWKKGAANP